MSPDAVFELVALGPVLLIWVLSVRDVLRRRDVGRTHRWVLAVAIALFPPLAVPYLLLRPPGSVRRGSVHRGDPRAEVVEALERSAAA